MSSRQRKRIAVFFTDDPFPIFPFRRSLLILILCHGAFCCIFRKAFFFTAFKSRKAAESSHLFFYCFPALHASPDKIRFEHFPVVDQDILPRDRTVQHGEIIGQLGDLLRLRPFPEQRFFPHRRIQGLALQNMPVGLGDHAAGRDAVAGDAAGRCFQRQIFHISHDPRLACHIEGKFRAVARRGGRNE